MVIYKNNRFKDVKIFFLLDYQNNENSIKTDNTKSGSYVVALSNQIQEKYNEVERLKSDVILIHTL
ncbi:CRASP family complement regulator-acquiring lipoprotein [Borreliella turdi]|uniref:CRASP family complement regulator-acquiring lipoprotein n=1 Tax=Borreliella turdi TaxID=57863 RepID=UPI002E18E624